MVCYVDCIAVLLAPSHVLQPAAVAAIAESYNDEYTSRYLADLGQMRKVVLQVDNDRHLQEFASTLRSRDVRHHVWVRT